MIITTPAVVLGLSRWHAITNAYDFTGSFRFAWALSFASILVVSAYAFGLPDAVHARRSAGPALAAVGAGAGSISLLQLVVGDALLPRSVVFGSAILLAPCYIVLAVIASGGATRQEDRVRVLFVGSEPEAAALAVDVRMMPEHPVQLASVLTPTEARPEPPDRRPLSAAAAISKATVLVLSREAQADEVLVHEAAALHERGLRVRTLSLFYEHWLGKLPLQELERISLMFDISELHRREYSRTKRLLDIFLALTGAVLLVVLIPPVVIGNLIANRGPLFYRQLRVGKGAVTFEILKFRTMRPHHGRLLNEWTVEHDPRITPFGRVLRRSHIDELPQMLNILRGDLSIVGPRPEQPAYVEELVAKLPFYAVRHLVRPGLTGWAQVKYGYAGNESDALEKLQYDFYYLRHQSVPFDLRIIGRTLRSVVGRRGR